MEISRFYEKYIQPFVASNGAVVGIPFGTHAVGTIGNHDYVNNHITLTYKRIEKRKNKAEGKEVRCKLKDGEVVPFKPRKKGKKLDFNPTVMSAREYWQYYRFNLTPKVSKTSAIMGLLFSSNVFSYTKIGDFIDLCEKIGKGDVKGLALYVHNQHGMPIVCETSSPPFPAEILKEEDDLGDDFIQRTAFTVDLGHKIRGKFLLADRAWFDKLKKDVESCVEQGNKFGVALNPECKFTPLADAVENIRVYKNDLKHAEKSAKLLATKLEAAKNIVKNCSVPEYFSNEKCLEEFGKLVGLKIADEFGITSKGRPYIVIPEQTFKLPGVTVKQKFKTKLIVNAESVKMYAFKFGANADDGGRIRHPHVMYGGSLCFNHDGILAENQEHAFAAMLDHRRFMEWFKFFFLSNNPKYNNLVTAYPDSYKLTYDDKDGAAFNAFKVADAERREALLNG